MNITDSLAIDGADISKAATLTQAILGTTAGTDPADPGTITAPMADPDRVTDLLVGLRDAGIGLAEVSVQKPTLDEVFLAITGHGSDRGSDAENSADADPAGADPQENAA